MALVLAVLAGTAAAQPLDVTEVAPGVFVHAGAHQDFTPENAGAIANVGFIVGERAVAVVDSGGSAAEGRRLLEAVEARTDRPIRWVVNTHLHPDHTFGNAAFAGPEVDFIGHARLARRLAEAGPSYLRSMQRLLGPAAADTRVVGPTVTVEDRLSLDLGGRTLELRAWPTAHTDTDLTALDSATRTLFAGDLVFIERIPVVDGRLNGWLETLSELERLPAARVVPGHGPASAPWPQALRAERAYLEGLRTSVRAAIAGNLSLARASESLPVPAGQRWRLAGENHPRNVIAAFTELEWE
jgi:quinoprotein relay system zinc metallohydrolase 2